MTYRLLDDRGVSFESAIPGTLGGNRRLRIYGRLDCPIALRALARGSYARHRVFFADEATAVSAGYRPCGVCLRAAYARWKTGAKRSERPRHPTRVAIGSDP